MYRRYRPLSLEGVVGQEQVTKPLSASLKAGKIGHAYLFIGPRGTGKTSVARILAHEVNGFKYELEDDYVDIIEIDGASNRGIDNVRELREKAAIAPTKGNYKIYIIDEVHMLTKEAFNALLKTLEEPPQHVIFIMATTDAHKVPVTIVSRSQTYTFKLADRKVMFDFLKKVAKAEKINISDEALEIIVKRGGGSFRDSLSLLDQISTLSDGEITKELVVSSMGLPEDEKITKLLSEYVKYNSDDLEDNAATLVSTLKDLLSTGIKPETLAEEIINTIIDEPKSELMPLLEKLPEVREPFGEARLLVALVDDKKKRASRSQMTPVKQKEQESGMARSEMAANASNTTAKKPGIVTKPPEAAAITAETTGVVVNFDWSAFLEQARKTSEVIYKQLTKCEYEIKDRTLYLYPRTNIIKNILESKNNKRILLDIAQNNKVMVCKAGEHPENVEKDKTLDKISAIMGGEVINDNGGYSPF